MDTIYDTPEETDVPVAHSPHRSTSHANHPDDVPAEGSRPRGRPYSREVNWSLFGIIAASVAAGAVLGAGVALLVAPYSGEHARLALGQEFRRRRPWRSSPWDRLGNELAKVAQRRNRRSSQPPPRFTAR